MDDRSALLFPLQCPKCGAAVAYNRETDTYSCDYCGIAFKLLTPGDSKSYQRAIGQARKSYDRFRFRDARKYYQEASDCDPDSWEAELGIAACDVMLSTWRNYGGKSFEATKKNLVKRMASLPEPERKEAKLRLAYHLADISAFCFLKLWNQVFDAWDKYDDYSMHMFDVDDDGPGAYPDAEEPDVSYSDVELDYETWMQEAVGLVLEAVPEGEPLGEKELEIVDYFLSYTTVWRKDKESNQRWWVQTQVAKCREELKKRNPDSDGFVKESRFYQYAR